VLDLEEVDKVIFEDEDEIEDVLVDDEDDEDAGMLHVKS
jgi:hypothetical protein